MVDELNNNSHLGKLDEGWQLPFGARGQQLAGGFGVFGAKGTQLMTPRGNNGLTRHFSIFRCLIWEREREKIEGN